MLGILLESFSKEFEGNSQLKPLMERLRDDSWKSKLMSLVKNKEMDILRDCITELIPPKIEVPRPPSPERKNLYPNPTKSTIQYKKI